MPVVLLGFGLLTVMGAMVLIGLSRTHDYTLGALLTSVAQWFINAGNLGIPILGTALTDIGHGIAALDNTIRDAIGQGIEALGEPLVGILSRSATALEAIGQTAADVGTATDQALQRMLRATIPALIVAKIASLASEVHVGNTITHVITRTIPGKIERVAAVTKVYPVTVERVAGLPALVDAAVDSALAAAAIPHAIPRVGDISTGIESAWQEIKRLGKYATVGGLIGLVGATVFSHFGLGWLRCSNTNKVGKALCGFNTSRLEALLAGLAVFLGTLDLVVFANDVKAVTETFTGEVRHIWRADVKHAGAGHTFGTSGI